MTSDARTEALTNPGVPAGSEWSKNSRVKYGRTNVFDGAMMRKMLGTWWDRWFGDRDELKNMYSGTGQAYYESYLKFLDAVSCLAKSEIPIFKTRNWYYYTVKKSSLVNANMAPLHYGDDGIVYHNKDVPAYGTTGYIDTYVFDLPEGLKSVPTILNRVIDPSLVLVDGRDYAIIDDKLHFFSNPFDNELIPTRPVLNEDGTTADHELALWFHLSDWDLNYVYEHFGYVLGVWLESSDWYRQLVSALWDNMVGGSAERVVIECWEAMTGIRFAVGNEVVTFIETFADKQMVITDNNVYEYHVEADIIVQEGDVLAPGQALVDTVRIVEPNDEADWDIVMGISLGKGLLSGNYKAPLVFQNRDVPINYLGTFPDGKVRIDFSVSGEIDDIAEFWRNVHIKGGSLQSLADVLDQRVNKIGEPSARNFALYINPFEFVMENILANNTYAVIVKPQHFIEGALGMSSTVHMHRYLPPHTTFAVFICLDGVTETIDISSNISDTSDISAAGTSASDWFSTVVDKNLTIRTIPEACR